MFEVGNKKVYMGYAYYEYHETENFEVWILDAAEYFKKGINDFMNKVSIAVKKCENVSWDILYVEDEESVYFIKNAKRNGCDTYFLLADRKPTVGERFEAKLLIPEIANTVTTLDVITGTIEHVEAKKGIYYCKDCNNKQFFVKLVQNS